MKPYLLAAHIDVVPPNEEYWTLSPWNGSVIKHPHTDEEVVWGRGAIDDKASAIVSKMLYY